MIKKKTLLIADDSPLIRKIFRDLLSDEYNIIEAQNGVIAIEKLQQYEDQISAILLDMVMPHLDGFQVLIHMTKHNMLERIPVIMVTATEAEKYITLAYDMGASEVIIKPFKKNIITKRIGNLVDLYTHKNHLEEIVLQQTESLKVQTKRLKTFNDLMIDALSTVIEYRSLESGQHIRRIRGFTNILLEQIARKLPHNNLSPETIEIISSASAMHDIGKIAIPDSVLLKPGKLTLEEYEVIKTHTTKGSEILYRLHGLDDKQYLAFCHDICLYHHERWDGTGYPEGLVGDQIPLSAQVVSIADAFDALTHSRIYKPAYTPVQATDMIVKGQCGIFSPELLKYFIQVLPQFEQLSETYED